MSNLTPSARQALAALDLFGVTDADDASTLLTVWPRRDELTEADLRDVLACFAGGYRDVDAVPGTPLPAGVEGFEIHGRQSTRVELVAYRGMVQILAPIAAKLRQGTATLAEIGYLADALAEAADQLGGNR